MKSSRRSSRYCSPGRLFVGDTRECGGVGWQFIQFSRGITKCTDFLEMLSRGEFYRSLAKCSDLCVSETRYCKRGYNISLSVANPLNLEKMAYTHAALNQDYKLILRSTGIICWSRYDLPRFNYRVRSLNQGTKTASLQASGEGRTQ